MEPVKTYCAWTKGTGPISRAIAWITVPVRSLFRRENVPSHMLVVFEDEEGNKEYFEAHYDTDWTGPHPWEELLLWKGEIEGRKIWISDVLPIGPDASKKLYIKAEGLVGIWVYNKKQILQMWVWRRLRLPVPHSPVRVVCSEAVGRLLRMYYCLCTLAKVRSPEYLTPDNTKRNMKHEEV